MITTETLTPCATAFVSAADKREKTSLLYSVDLLALNRVGQPMKRLPVAKTLIDKLVYDAANPKRKIENTLLLYRETFYRLLHYTFETSPIMIQQQWLKEKGKPLRSLNAEKVVSFRPETPVYFTRTDEDDTQLISTLTDLIKRLQTLRESWKTLQAESMDRF